MKPKLTIKLGAMPSPKEESGEYPEETIKAIGDVLKDFKAALDSEDYEEAARLFCSAQDMHGEMDEEMSEDAEEKAEGE